MNFIILYILFPSFSEKIEKYSCYWQNSKHSPSKQRKTNLSKFERQTQGQSNNLLERIKKVELDKGEEKYSF